MSKIPLVFEPNTILHAVAKPVEVVDAEIKQLSLNMAETMTKDNGVGLAAPQIGRSIRMFVVLHRDGIKTLINPDIYWRSLGTEIDEEGCLSLPGVFGNVKRSKSIKVRYTDENGVKQDVKADGFFARVIQHENDHLDGILFISKLEK